MPYNLCLTGSIYKNPLANSPYTNTLLNRAKLWRAN
ncbi:hypothetical protein PHET_12323 [Paragonimus heterotremus]|uniref:Uncharacterized protein n=1 Tax=Paragonimus heterotremus TaxID=100268 RepID=A0A8J4WD86_9TREM|nr:hypothetical protein PHET_12323 [Paragonimus heterotremus]